MTLLEKNLCHPRKLRKMSPSKFLELAEWESYNSPKNKSFVDLDGFKLPFYSKDEKVIYDHIVKYDLAQIIRGQALRIPIPKTEKSFYPDIIYLNHNNEVVIVEVKSKTNMSTYDELVKYHALRTYCYHQGFHYTMIDKRFTSIQSFCKMNYNKKLEKMIIQHLKTKGLLDSKAVTQLREQHFSHIKRKNLDKMVTAIIIRNRYIDEKVNKTQLHVINKKHYMYGLCYCN